MKITIYEILNGNIRTAETLQYHSPTDKKGPLYLVNMLTDNRKEAGEELNKRGPYEEISQKILTPSEHLRFEYSGNILYGEIAYFSSKLRKADTAAFIIDRNVLFVIHALDEGKMEKIVNSFPSFSEKQKSRLTDIDSLFFYLVHEVLSYHGREVLFFREAIEMLADQLMQDHLQVKPDYFLRYRTRLSALSRVIERLTYTLSIPPAENVLDLDNPYRPYFEDLLKGLTPFKLSLEHTEDRLDSLYDHYQLLMQDKMNKRLNLLAIIQSIFLPLTLIAGIYGMNFKYMPELDHPYAYFMTLGGMFLIAAGFIWYFYRHKWFD